MHHARVSENGEFLRDLRTQAPRTTSFNDTNTRQAYALPTCNFRYALEESELERQEIQHTLLVLLSYRQDTSRQHPHALLRTDAPASTATPLDLLPVPPTPQRSLASRHCLLNGSARLTLARHAHHLRGSDAVACGQPMPWCAMPMNMMRVSVSTADWAASFSHAIPLTASASAEAAAAPSAWHWWRR